MKGGLKTKNPRPRKFEMRVRIGLMGFALVFRGNEWAKNEWVMLSFNVPSVNLLD